MEHLIRWLPQRLLHGPFVDALDWALAIVITLAAATLLVMAIAFVVRGFADVARRVRLAIIVIRHVRYPRTP